MLAVIQPSPALVAPFVLLLTAVALAPLWFANWWGRHCPKVILGVSLLVVGYYLAGLHAQERVMETATDYVSFVCLVGSLFVVSGGIHIHIRGQASPAVNVLFLLAGALVANLLGTTGASMLLIRPWLRLNKYRLTAHHVVFFIFLVSNVGGSLTPVGDPPLFLGYLKGVPFWWMAKQCWLIWLVAVGFLLVAFYGIDSCNYRRASREVRAKETAHERWRFQGLGNLFFLAVILAAVLVRRPPFLREILMVAAAAGSYFTTAKPVHDANDFNFAPIKEVALLFAGIFATMMPALDWLQANAAHFGQPTPGLYFWGSGALSSVLDNAPTYLSFFSAACGAFVSPHAPALVGAASAGSDPAQMAVIFGSPLSLKCLQAISLGSVFFGANTYIGNGPNFMVKAIADQQKAHTPTFLGYFFKYTLPYMLPMLLLVWWLFFRG